MQIDLGYEQELMWLWSICLREMSLARRFRETKGNNNFKKEPRKVKQGKDSDAKTAL